MATWADVRSVLAGLPGTRESDGAWRVAGRVVARPSGDGSLAVWRDEEWAHVAIDGLDRGRLGELLTEAWEQRAPKRVVRERKGTS